jgi:P4 family phage/plasmid primase-like protien
MTDAAFDAWRQRARDADILDVAMRPPVSAELKKRAREHVGPCPRCAGKDRFSVNSAKQIFNCRGAAGGDVIAMVMHCQAVSFLAACELINGEPPPAQGTQLTDAARAAAEKARAESAERAKRRDADENLYRERERQKVGDIYKHAHPLAGSSAEDYLTLRGLTFPATPEGRAERIKCVEAMPYFVGGAADERIVHRGPAMIMPIVDRERKFRGLHFTYLDLTTPKGKLQLEHGGEIVDAKKSRGSVGGNHVELIGPVAPRRLVLGEGAEKVIAAWQALDRRARAGELPIGNIALDETAFWSACNLGNLAGPAVDTMTHPTRRHERSGRAVKVAGQVPDFEGAGIAIPDTVVDLVLLGDSTSDEFTTRLAMARACARYASPGRAVRVAWAPAGKDFDDLWRACDQTPGELARVATAIAATIEAAAPAAPVANYSSVEPGVGRDRDPGGSETEKIISFPGSARARESAPGAPQQTSAGDAGAPDGLADADAGHSSADPPDPAAAALGPAPPPALPREKKQRPSRSGRSAGSGGGKWGSDELDLEGDELDRALAWFPQTDLGNAERCVHRFRHRLKYSVAHGWFFWSGSTWAAEGAEAELIVAEHETVRGIQAEAAAIEREAGGLVSRLPKPAKAPDGNVVDIEKVRSEKRAAKDEAKKLKGKRDEMIALAAALRKHGRASEAAARMGAIGKRARGALKVLPSELDADPFKINVANGTLVVRRNWARAPIEASTWQIVNEFIRFKPHDPADLITKRMPVEFDPDADAQLYDEFLEFVQPNPDNRRHLHQCGGMCLTGDISEQVMWFNWGKGKNGKSTLFNAWSYVMGDYGRSVAIETFLTAGASKAGAAASPDLARLEGVRFVRTSEPERGAKLAEALIKLATGGEPMTVRHLNKDFFELHPRFKLVMSGNYRPEVRGTDEGIWRRIRLIPWTVAIPVEKRDRDFGEKLHAEASGILNRLLAGLVDWLKHGLSSPTEIEQATADYRKDSDPLGRFLDACVETKDGERVQSSVLHSLFCAWCRANGEKEWTATGFGRALAERGFQRRHSDVNYWLNIRPTKTVADFAGAQPEPPPHGAPISTTQNKGADPSADEDAPF